MTRDDAALLDIASAPRYACQFAQEVDGWEAFDANPLDRSAVLHQLMVLGEAAKRLSAAYREAHPDLPWKSMAGMRDKLIHHYDGVDFDVTWDTVTLDLPDLLDLIEPLLPEV